MNESRRDQVVAGLASVRQRIDAARQAAGRRDEVALTVVTKTFPASDVDVLASLGVADVGENRDQEGRAKKAAADAPGLRWHMIGQLQRNKAAGVAGWADIVESVDRMDLVAPLARGASSREHGLDVLIQVCLDPEPAPGRGGADPRTVLALADAIAAEPTLHLRGVMGVAPYPGDPDEAFARLRAVADAVAQRWPGATTVSAGMSGDLEQAVRHGATQVRVGGAVLGPRPPVQ
ncbi:MAG: YggS family pyridoxal phosphate-dependent enzyme [Actinomycetota bacterium]|nr:YggS family pyridoxal phosphate-dependent enzyme [Actinomycetota bacterium]